MASIQPKTSLLGYDNAAHLLRRTTYKITKSLINAYALKTPQQALDDLFLFTDPNPTRPLDDLGNTYFPTYNETSYTSTSPLTDSNDKMNYNWWWQYHALTTPTIQYRLINWLHTLFVVSSLDTTHFAIYDYLELLRFHSNGSLKELAIRMSRNPRMLYYLDNRVNTNGSPNQNYAREFLELFTILKGDQIGTGDYTTYTEVDVQQAARVLTGFSTNTNQTDHRNNRILEGNVDPITKLPMGTINIASHDSGNKTFSNAFNNTVIQGGNTADGIQQELEDFVTMVFDQSATAKSYCRRLYRYFVSRNITTEIEDDIISPLATSLMYNDYNIVPVVKQLLSCKHFYDEDDSTVGDEVIGALVKSPLDLFLQQFSIFEIELPNYTSNTISVNQLFALLRQKSLPCSYDWLKPNNVNGYPAYTGSPKYDRNWITTSSLRARYAGTLIDNLLYQGITTIPNYQNYILTIAEFVRDSGYFSSPSNADTLLIEFYDLLFVAKPQGNRHTYFRNAFLGSLSIINWQNNWNAYIQSNNKTEVTYALNRLIRAMVKSPEYQVM